MIFLIQYLCSLLCTSVVQRHQEDDAAFKKLLQSAQQELQAVSIKHDKLAAELATR